MRLGGEELRARLEEAGLGGYSDALLALGAGAVRVRAVGGQGEPRFRVTPTVVGGVVGEVVAVTSSRGTHALALFGDGTVAGWGANDRGQLGDGSRSDSDEAVLVRGVDSAVAVAGGGSHSLALLRDGSVLGWGDNSRGQLCDAKRTYSAKPIPIAGLDRWVRAIAAGEESSFAVLEDGSVVGWGAVHLGPGVRADDAPVAIPGLDGGVVALASGRWHAVALLEDGSLRAWGTNRFGSLCDGTNEDRYEPVPVPGLDGPVVAVAAGTVHSLALMADGVVMAWGGSSDVVGTPVRVALDGEAVAIAAGGLRSHALLRDGSVFSWGANSWGELADGTVTPRQTPVRARGMGTGVRVIAAGAALLDDGSLRRWGGQLPAGDHGADAAIPIGASKLGGMPDLPTGTGWPRHDGRPMALLAQIDLAEAAAHVEPGEPLPRAGLLSLFVAPDALDEPGSWQLLFTTPGVTLARLPAPPELADADRIPASRLSFQRELSWPSEHSPALEALGLSWPQIMSYVQAVDADGDRPIHRMLGHPNLIQPPDPPDAYAGLCLLLQIDSDDDAGWSWGDVGCLHLWIDPDDLAAGRFDRAVLCAQSS